MPGVHHFSDLQLGLNDVSRDGLSPARLRSIGVNLSAQVIRANPQLDPGSPSDRPELARQLGDLLKAVGLIPDPDAVLVDGLTKARTRHGAPL